MRRQRTLEASDGASALALARAERPDLILLDIMLPEVDGWQVAQMTNTVGTVVERGRRGERDAVRREWQRSIGQD